MTTRAEWQQLAEDRIRDAQALLSSAVDRWSAAFYLIGYAVECGLKSCVLARVAAHPEVVYEDRKFSNDAWTHDIESLLVVADIKADRITTPQRIPRCTRTGNGSKTGMKNRGTSKRPTSRPNDTSTPLPIRIMG